jgi:hemerythrin-like domain-containing protein
MDIHQARTEIIQEEIVNMDVHHERLAALIDVFEERLKKTETTDLEANPEEIDYEVEHEEVPKE